MIGCYAADGLLNSGLESYLYRLDSQLAFYSIETYCSKGPSTGSSLFQFL